MDDRILYNLAFLVSLMMISFPHISNQRVSFGIQGERRECRSPPLSSFVQYLDLCAAPTCKKLPSLLDE